MTDSPTSTPKSGFFSDLTPETIRLIISITCTSTIAWISYFGQAQMWDPVVEAFGQDDERTGFLWTIEVTAMVLTMFVAAGPLTRWSRVKVAITGSLIFIVSNLASAYLANLGTEFLFGSFSVFDGLIATRIVASMGAGVMASAGTAAAASSLNPGRIYAITTITWGLLAAGEGILITLLIGPYGAAGGFIFFSIAAVCLLPFSFWLLPPKRNEQEEAKGESVWLALRSAPNRKLAIYAMLAMFIYEVGQGAVYVLTAKIGGEVGMTPTEVGWAYTWASYLGLLGGAAAAWLGNRAGYLKPVVLAIFFNVVPAVLYIFCESGLQFFVLYTIWSMAYYFLTPYIYDALARLDKLGRWVVALEAAWTAGDAVAPWIGGSIVQYLGYGYISWLVGLTGLFGLVVLVGVMRRLDGMNVDNPPPESAAA
jgi:predicted MFS family arabinose efflux permease